MVPQHPSQYLLLPTVWIKILIPKKRVAGEGRFPKSSLPKKFVTDDVRELVTKKGTTFAE